MIKKILLTLWTAWCVVVISSVILLFLPLFAILVHSGIKSWNVLAHKLVHLGARIVVAGWGIRVVEHNKEIVDASKQYIYVSNHRSDLDPVVLLTVMRGYFKFLGKAELLKWPMIGYLVGQLYATVNRSDEGSRDASMRKMASQLKDGASIMIYPEGWSNFSDRYILPLKRGAFRLAILSKLPVAVMTITHSHELWPKPNWRVHPGTVHIYWERIVDTSHLKTGDTDDYDWLEDEVTNTWMTRLSSVYPDGYPNAQHIEVFEAWKEGQLRR